MKEPTTQWSIETQKKIKINRQFLLSQGWMLSKEYPLFESYVHSRNSDFECSIGLYGSFFIAELHWCNKTPERIFSTINPKLTEEDYFKIIDLLNIRGLIK